MSVGYTHSASPGWEFYPEPFSPSYHVHCPHGPENHVSKTHTLQGQHAWENDPASTLVPPQLDPFQSCLLAPNAHPQTPEVLENITQSSSTSPSSYITVRLPSASHILASVFPQFPRACGAPASPYTRDFQPSISHCLGIISPTGQSSPEDRDNV